MDREVITSTQLANLTETLVQDIPRLSQLREIVRERYMQLHDFSNIMQSAPSTAITPTAVLVDAIEQLVSDQPDQIFLWKTAFNSCLKVLGKITVENKTTDQAQTRTQKRKTDADAETRVRPKVSGIQVTAVPQNKLVDIIIPTDDDFEILVSYLKSTDLLFAVPSQGHISCRQPGCKFCREMFCNTDVTSCGKYDHKNCTKSGFFPHVGIKLWKILRSKHNSGVAYCREPPKHNVSRYTLSAYNARKSANDSFAAFISTKSTEPRSTAPLPYGSSPRYEPSSPVLFDDSE